MTALATLLADPSQPIAFVVELSYRDPDTDTDSTVRVTSSNWVGAGEVGYLRGLLDDPGDQAVAVEVEEGGGIAQASLAPMRFLNIPPSMGAAGPLDFLRDKTLGGRSVTLYAGAPDEPIASYEQLGSGLADGEPEFDDDGRYMTIRRKTALELLRQDLEVGTYVGEPGALKILTSTGKASAADNVAHHLTEFTIAGRFRSASVGATNRFISRRLSGSTYNWLIALLGTSGVLRAAYTHSAGTAVNLTSAARYDDDSSHWFAFGLRAGHNYLMVDGEVVSELITTFSPDQPTAGVVQGISFDAPGSILDQRILNHYIPPDEARAWMATRASGDEEGLVGLWRGDDATGSTLTDYSPTAAHATISGTAGVDFAHVSSDLGEPEIAGQSMPALLGG